jgi:hypothetical protein
MTNLQSKINEVKVTYVCEEGIQYKTYHCTNIPIENIADFVSLESRLEQPGFYELEKTILEEGMRNPILLVPNSIEEYEAGSATVNTTYLSQFNPTKPYLCIFGNQRLAIAKRNNFSSISSIIVKRSSFAILVQSKLL